MRAKSRQPHGLLILPESGRKGKSKPVPVAGRGHRWAARSVFFSGAIYVLHAFQKKSPKGIKTAKGDVEMVARRLKLAREMYGKSHGKEK